MLQVRGEVYNKERIKLLRQMIECNLESSFAPTQAIIIYKEKEEEKFYLESHPIYEINGKKVLGEGKPLEKSTVENIASFYYQDATQGFRARRLLPTNLLYCQQKVGSHILIWHTKRRRQHLYFSSALGIESGDALLPSLLFVAINDTLSVFALGDGKVSLNSKIYTAPFHNVNEKGRVCMGNAKIGKVQNVEYEEAIAEWEKAFFNSEFTALNTVQSPTVSNLNLLWKRLIETKEKFPLEELRPHPMGRVSNLLEKL